MKKLLICLFFLSAFWVNILYANDVNEAKLTAADGDSLAQFGCSVSISGGYAIIGAAGDDENGPYSGAAYIFLNSASVWEEKVKLLPKDAASSAWFGKSVSISDNYAIVGAHNDITNLIQMGSAYIFRREDTNWIEEDKLVPGDGASYDKFGYSLSISGDYAIVGAPHNDQYGQKSGSAYIFKRDGINWIQQAKLVSSDIDSFDVFGHSVSISGDYAIVGVRNDDDNGTESGSAYIFKRDGTIWIQQTKLKASDGEELDQFGYSVAIDGDYAVVGVPQDDDNGFNSGSVYIFKRNESTWFEQDKLTASDGFGNMSFGCSVSIDGDYVVAGASFEFDNRVGSVYIFRRDSLSWREETRLTASDGTTADGFGQSVSIAGDYTIVGAALDDDNGNDTGSSYIYSGITVGIGTRGSYTPTEFILYQNYPNPFNPATIINYNLHTSNHVTLKIYDLSGREIVTSVNGFQIAGEYRVKLTTERLPSGIYFYRLQAGEFSETKKMILRK
jgi:hypothetical protein